MSQGGEEDDDTHRKFLTTDQREWTFKCPECGQRQPFKWECVEWSKSARDEFGDWDFDEVRRTAAMRCESCNHHFDDGDRMRRELNATGGFVSKKRQCQTCDTSLSACLVTRLVTLSRNSLIFNERNGRDSNPR